MSHWFRETRGWAVETGTFWLSKDYEQVIAMLFAPPWVSSKASVWPSEKWGATFTSQGFCVHGSASFKKHTTALCPTLSIPGTCNQGGLE